MVGSFSGDGRPAPWKANDWLGPVFVNAHSPEKVDPAPLPTNFQLDDWSIVGAPSGPLFIRT
jgi:hypothetical protein